jgi:putative transposase
VVCLQYVATQRSLPISISVDIISELPGRALDNWAYINKVRLDFSRPGKTAENRFVESFNGKLRDECLNTEVYLSIADLREKLEQW